MLSLPKLDLKTEKPRSVIKDIDDAESKSIDTAFTGQYDLPEEIPVKQKDDQKYVWQFDPLVQWLNEAMIILNKIKFLKKDDIPPKLEDLKKVMRVFQEVPILNQKLKPDMVGSSTFYKIC